jgi:hypothetical protein
MITIDTNLEVVNWYECTGKCNKERKGGLNSFSLYYNRSYYLVRLIYANILIIYDQQIIDVRLQKSVTD